MNSRTIIVGLVALVVVSAGSAYYFYVRSQSAADPQQVAAEDAKQWVAAVGKLMVLPDELPIIATVADPDKLTSQPFFLNARKGDKVLIFNNARKAVLYSPEFDRIVDVAPLSIGQSSSTPSPSVTATPAR